MSQREAHLIKEQEARDKNQMEVLSISISKTDISLTLYYKNYCELTDLEQRTVDRVYKSKAKEGS